MAKERGLIKIIWRNFVASLKPTKGPQLIGEDFHGTKYYETPLRAQSSFKKPNRFFEPVNKEDFEQEVPTEWEAWLRYRRKEPPTQEEIMKNYQTMISTKKNAAELDGKYLEIKREMKAPETEPQNKIGSFPVYEEYKNYGADYQPKFKKDD